MQAIRLNKLTLMLTALAVVSLPLSVSSVQAQTQEEFLLLEALSPAELEALVGPIALYPDDLLSIVLDASAHPLQIVAASRFLDDVRNNPELKPDADWDESVVALLNYPEVLDFLNEDLEWTESLGFAFLDQQEELFAAVQNFRKRAYAAGNLKSDAYQKVVVENFVIKILPAEPDTIYIPAYEPAKVVVYHPYPVFGYYPYAYPVYYYPYAPHYSFAAGFFWGVTTYFVIDWISGGYHTHYYGFHGHPYYRHTYHYRNHYYYGGRHYAKHGRHHVRHARRHARRHIDYYRNHRDGHRDGYRSDGRRWKSSDTREYARRTEHRRYRDGVDNYRDQPRTVDGSRREQFARSDQRVRDARNDNRNTSTRNRTERNLRRNDRQVASLDRSTETTNPRLRQASSRDRADQRAGNQPKQSTDQSTSKVQRWKRKSGDQGINNRRSRPSSERERTSRDSRLTIAQNNQQTMRRTAPGAANSRATQRNRSSNGAAPTAQPKRWKQPQAKTQVQPKRWKQPQAKTQVQPKRWKQPQARQQAQPTRWKQPQAKQQAQPKRWKQNQNAQASQRQMRTQSRATRPQSARSQRSGARQSARASTRGGGMQRGGRGIRSAR